MNSEELNEEATQRLRQDADYQAFLKWAEDGGVVHPSLEFPAAFGPYGIMGLRATRDLSSQKAILFVPYKLCLGIQAANKALQPLFDAVPKTFQSHKYKNEFRLYALILHEKLKGDQSFYSPYIRILRDPEILMDWTEEELGELQDPDMFEKVSVYKRRLERYWRELEPTLLAYPQYFPPLEDFHSLFVWAYKLVQTRSFAWGDPEGMLIPFADFFNHTDIYANYETCTLQFLEENKSSTTSAIDYSDFTGTPAQRPDLTFGSRSFRSKLAKFLDGPQADQLSTLDGPWQLDDLIKDESSSDDDYKVDLEDSDTEVEPAYCYPQTEADYFVLSMGSKGSYRAGQQVCICYGRKNNLDLLMYYGFAVENNYRDAVHVDLPEKGDRPRASFKVKRNRFNQDSVLLFRKELMSSLVAAGVFKQQMAVVLGLKPVLPMIEIPTMTRALQFYKALKDARFSTSEEEDRALLASPASPGRLKIAICYRLSQRSILDSQIRLVETLLLILAQLKAGTWDHSLRTKTVDEVKAIYPLRNYLRAFDINQKLWEQNFFK